MIYPSTGRLMRRFASHKRRMGAESTRLVILERGDAEAAFNFTPIDIDGSGTGVVSFNQWNKDDRRGEDGTLTEQAIQVVPAGDVTRALLTRVGAYSIQALDEGSGLWTGDLHPCDPDGGVPQTTDEIAWRWLGRERVGTYTSGGEIPPSVSTFDFHFA